MAEKEKYMINIEGKLVEVSPDVYYAYFRMERQERGQEEKKLRNSVVSYDALDTEETKGEETMPDLVAPGPEQQLTTREIRETLHRAVEALPRADRELIKAIFFEGLTEQQYALASGTSQQGVSYRLRKILSKLKMFLNFMGSF
ncbi:MAG: sigma-70 family RNA polymerase sigma factor [Oscillospiraceae bacterium]|nr:sigma-70 family RNA polymerase sigma factor [Oscillospiraceae bacterium]